MVEFTSKPLDLKIGDIVIERHKPNAFPVQDYYWVITKVEHKPGFGNTKKGYYAFLLSDAEHTIGPIIFRSTKHWEYKVIHYD